jgi:nitrate reductase NapAB chaperone NapD
MIISGMVMVSKQGMLADLKAELAAIPWADDHFSDDSGRLVVTIEAKDIDESMDRLKELQALPSARMAELSQYCTDDEGFAPRDDSASDSEVATCC